MKIERIEIYGFGRWVDQTFQFFNQHMTCLFGENEAGKSTLQQFIMYMLFGLPPKLRNFYRPKQSNRIGGTITITGTKIGTFTIERVEDEVHCLLPNGEKRGEEWLHEQLNGLTKEMYTSIYSFSAVDLSAIRQMKAKQLSDVLFSVGLTGATSIYRVEKELDKKIGELFKKSGRNPHVNKQLKQVSERYAKLQTAKSLEKSYEEKVTKQKALKEQILHIQKKIRTLKEKLLELEKKKQLIPTLNEYQLASEKLCTYPEEIPFPEDGVARYDSLKHTLLPLKSEWQSVKKNIEEYEAKIGYLSEQLWTEEQLTHGQDLLKQNHQLKVQADKMSSLEKELVYINHQLSKLLQSVHLAEEEIDNIIFPFHTEKSWQELIDINGQLQQESEKLTDDHHMIVEQMERLQKEEATTKHRLLSNEELRDLERRVENFEVQQVKQKQKKQLDVLQQKRDKINRIILSSTSGLALISFLIVMYFENYPLLTIPIMISLVGIGQMILSKVSINEMKVIDFGDSTNISEVEWEQLSQQLTEQRQLQAQLQAIQTEQKRLRYHQQQLEERKRIFAQKESKWMDQIYKEQQHYPFLQKIEPAYWVEFFHTIQDIKQLLREKRKITDQIGTWRESNQLFQKQLEQFTVQMNVEEVVTIESIERMMEKQRSQVQLLDEYKKMKDHNKKQQEDLEEQMQIYQSEIDQLFQIAQVTSEEQYYQRASFLNMKKELITQKEKSLAQLKLSFQDEQLENFLHEELHENEVTIQLSEMTDQMEQLENELENKRKEITTIQLEINQLETSDDISTTVYLFEMEKDKLNQLAKEWAILKAAQTALIRAKQSYQEKYLHEVIHFTTEYFKQLTNGKYVKVFAPTDTELFQVEANNYIRYTVDELSQGTIDQLYVSLRLAIGKVMSDKFVVPFIIDDAFVHFDEVRTKEMLNLLSKIASNQQILLFTCKQHIANQFEHESIQKLVEVV